MDTKGSVIEAQLLILEQVINRELKVSRLYDQFSDRFPGQQELWRDLASEEMEHANRLRGMQDFIKQGHFLWNLGRLRDGVCEDEKSLIKDSERQLRLRTLDAAGALKIAVQIENSILDSKLYDIVNCDLSEFKELCENLRREETLHRNRLSDALVEFIASRH